MMKRIYFYLLTALLIVFVSSCSSSKNMKKGASIGNLSEAEYMEELINRAPAWDAVTAKIVLVVDMKGKGPTRLGGTLRIKRDEVIQLSLAPVLGIEIGRAEISPDGVLVMDRMNKRYVEVLFDELKKLANADLDFHTLQALFLNELFLPGKKALTARDVSAFAIRPENENAVIEVKNAKHFAYRFRTNTNDGLLKESHIGLVGTDYGVNWEYDQFRPLEQKQFPGYMRIAFEGGKKPVEAAFELSRLSTNSSWATHTEVPKKYEKVELQEILKLFLK